MKKSLFLLLLAVLLGNTAYAQTDHNDTVVPEIVLTTEGLWNLSTGVANWVNLLNVDYEFELWRGGSFALDLLAVANLRQEQGKSGVADNLHLFSAIEDSPSTLALMAFGVGQELAEGRVRLYAGVRNLGKDYFDTPWNSLFTSAMNGLFPSISTHFVVADAPYAAMALHGEWHPSPHWHTKLSIYDGVASDKWGDLFRVNLGRDGVFMIGEVGYKGTGEGYVGTYNLGATFGCAPTAEELAQGGRQKSRRASLWLLAEQPLWREAGGRSVCAVLHGAWAPRSDCNLYGALGAICNNLLRPKDYIGIIISRGLYRGGYETQLEVTYAIPWRIFTFQPAIHRVFAAQSHQTIAMMKVTLTI